MWRDNLGYRIRRNLRRRSLFPNGTWLDWRRQLSPQKRLACVASLTPHQRQQRGPNSAHSAQTIEQNHPDRQGILNKIATLHDGKPQVWQLPCSGVAWIADQ